MTDFLTNLAARTIGATPLRPRLRMRFEPAEAPSLPEPDPAAASDEGETVIAPTADPPPAVEPAPWVTEHRHVAAPARVEPERREPSPARVAAALPDTLWIAADEELPVGRGLIGDARVTDEPIRPDPVVRREPVLIDEAVARAVVPLGDRDAVRRSDDPVTGERVPLETAPPKRAAPHRYDERPPRPAERGVEDEVAAEEFRPTLAPARSRPRSTVQRTPAQPRPVADTDAPSAEPVVHVSIGRVEVRAVTPAAPRAPARRNPAMTIDEYVSKRRGRS